MMLDRDEIRMVQWGYVAVLALAAGYVLVVRRRSPRAAAFALAGLGLYALYFIDALTGWGPEGLLRSAGVGAPFRTRIALWSVSIQWASACGLLVWAVITDRPPAALEE